MVRRRFVGELVAAQPVAEAPLGGDAALGEELERPVHRGVPDALVTTADLVEEVLDRHVRRALEERVDD